MPGDSIDFRQLFEAAPDVLLVLLPDAPRFTMVAATKARFEVTHTGPDTLGRGLFEVFPDNPDETGATGTSNLRASLERVIATRMADTMAVQKYDIRGPDGVFQSRYWSPKNIPVLSNSGELEYILHRVEDVSDLVQASELGQELRDKTRKMELEVLARSRELADTNRSLRDANARLGELDRAKTAFFSNVSHEFRTPLTLILSPVERAVGTAAAVLGGEDLSAVHRNAQRLLQLVNSLLDFSRIESEALAMSFAPVDLAQLTAGLAGAFQSLFDEAGVALVIDCPELPDVVFVDTAQWEKVVMNLVSNAFKFTLEGQVKVALSWQGDHVELRVSDTGTGIPEAELPRMFERFHRVEGARGRSFEGSGIGLSLVHELVRLHGGRVTVTSELGRGSTFTVSIPTGRAHLPPERVLGSAPVPSGVAARAASQLLEARQWMRAAPSGGQARLESDEPESLPARAAAGRVLVAEDNADMRDFIARLLAPHWVTELVPNGRLALESALRNPPDLVLSDMMMPELDGAALLDALRKNPKTETVPVILISARAGEEARLAGLETGADDYLVKPFAARELLTRVRTQLEMTRVRRASAEAARALAETRATLMAALEAEHAALREAHTELKRTQAQLVQSAKMASLGQLVAGIAHELNNPLAFSLGHLHTIQSNLARLRPEAGSAALADSLQVWERASARAQELRTGLDRIRDLVAHLRTFSRLDEGDLKWVSVRDSIDSVLMILRNQLGDGIQVELDLTGPDTVECQPGPLNQAIMNLVSNAIDAIAGPGTIAIRTREHDGWFEFAVEDTGAGIPEAIRDRVFEPFFTTKPVGSGTGLGLAITHSIAEQHGGTVELLPRDAGGTRAVFRFPLGR